MSRVEAREGERGCGVETRVAFRCPTSRPGPRRATVVFRSRPDVMGRTGTDSQPVPCVGAAAFDRPSPPPRLPESGRPGPHAFLLAFAFALGRAAAFAAGFTDLAAPAFF